jgi:hypothetical protein
MKYSLIISGHNYRRAQNVPLLYSYSIRRCIAWDIYSIVKLQVCVCVCVYECGFVGVLLPIAYQHSKNRTRAPYITLMWHHYIPCLWYI